MGVNSPLRPFPLGEHLWVVSTHPEDQTSWGSSCQMLAEEEHMFSTNQLILGSQHENCQHLLLVSIFCHKNKPINIPSMERGGALGGNDGYEDVVVVVVDDDEEDSDKKKTKAQQTLANHLGAYREEQDIVRYCVELET